MIHQARLATVVGKVAQLKAIASELFGGPIEVSIENDVDLGMQFIVLAVQSSGDVREIANRRAQWYNRTGAVLRQDCELVRLIVTVSE